MTFRVDDATGRRRTRVRGWYKQVTRRKGEGNEPIASEVKWINTASIAGGGSVPSITEMGDAPRWMDGSAAARTTLYYFGNGQHIV